MGKIIPLNRDDLDNLLDRELLVVGANVDGHLGRVYEVISRSLDQVTGLYLGDLYESTFNRGGCGCGGEINAEGDYLLLVGRISFHPRFALGGSATKYVIKFNETLGDTHEIFLYFEKTPTEKVLMTLK